MARWRSFDRLMQQRISVLRQTADRRCWIPGAVLMAALWAVAAFIIPREHAGWAVGLFCTCYIGFWVGSRNTLMCVEQMLSRQDADATGADTTGGDADAHGF